MTINSAYDWVEIARLALASRMMDELEKNELLPQGLGAYQYSSKRIFLWLLN